ncbi:Hypothetical Protein SLY_0808 [Strawberry lethal yellows phytoplasma (CPA) str. NZSb11]|uniref:Uncharacterized protein n=1 Tax=Strawberry lethal yellows phytoplasma (CPA) str. NZSb11 TaxID=980422 RepID=R4S1M9_PHYAS|nr:Hypothetical Protein SLY_0808 [Strawberry lethal yellows phytoplasma (CPA) str. NZSb11]
MPNSLKQTNKAAIKFNKSSLLYFIKYFQIIFISLKL